MDPFLIMMGMGGLLKNIGMVKGAYDQAGMERQNADFLREQADWAQTAGKRDEKLLTEEAARYRGRYVAAVGSSGFAFGGEEATQLSDANRRVDAAMDAIREQTRQHVREALLKAGSADSSADKMTDPLTLALGWMGNNLGTGVVFTKEVAPKGVPG